MAILLENGLGKIRLENNTGDLILNEQTTLSVPQFKLKVLINNQYTLCILKQAPFN